MNLQNSASIHRILLAVDGSEHSRAAAILLNTLPIPKNCQITALAVMLPRHAQYHETYTHILAQVQDIFSSRGRKIETQLLAGHPADEINQFALKYLPDMIVIGALGLRATLGILLGGVAQQVVEYASRPVLIVRAPYKPIRKVLLVTDGSAHSLKTIEHLSICPLPSETTFAVMHVLPPAIVPDMLIRSWPGEPDVITYLVTPEMEERLAQQAAAEEENGTAILAEAAQKLFALGIQAETVLKRGDAATEMITYAKENSVDLVIAGSRGLSSVQGWLLGSVSRKLVHYAPCSVLIVKTADE